MALEALTAAEDLRLRDAREPLRSAPSVKVKVDSTFTVLRYSTVILAVGAEKPV